MRKKWVYLSLWFCLFLLSGCSSTTSQQDTSVKLVDANAEIQSLYSNRCLNCHAIDLSGMMGESTNLQHVYDRLTYDELFSVISEGRELMPSFKNKLTEDEIDGLAKWLAKQ